MTIELALPRAVSRLSLALTLSLAAAAAQAQDAPPPADDSAPSAEARDEAQQSRRESRRSRRQRTEISAYLEVAQVLSADLGSGGDTLTYTSLAAGADGSIQTRRVTAQMSIRYQRNVEWNNGGVDSDVISGIAAVNAQVVPGVLNFDAGLLATRTGGDGRVFGITNRDASVDVYAGYAGPTLATHVGPLALNASYRFGYVTVDDHRAGAALNDDFDSATAHSASASVGMAPGGSGLPFGWTVGAGYARTDTGGRWDQRFEGMYVRGDVVFPISPTLAVTAGVGYENFEADQRDFVRDGTGAPVIGPTGPSPDPTAPRLLTYDLDGTFYDAGVIWRPSPRTELQVRAGRRYGGTTVAGSLDHRIGQHSGIHAEVFDTVDTFGGLVTGDVAGLPDQFDANRDPLTGGLSGCVFGAQSGRCFDRSLSSINGNSFRMRGGSLVFSGERRLWSYGVGVGYAHRRYNRPALTGLPAFASEDEVYSIYGTVGRQLSRTSEVNFDAFASWYDSDANVNTVSSLGATLSYQRSLLLERLQLMAALGLYHSDDGVEDSTNASALGGLRYTF